MLAVKRDRQMGARMACCLSWGLAPRPGAAACGQKRLPPQVKAKQGCQPLSARTFLPFAWREADSRFRKLRMNAAGQQIGRWPPSEDLAKEAKLSAPPVRHISHCLTWARRVPAENQALRERGHRKGRGPAPKRWPERLRAAGRGCLNTKLSLSALTFGPYDSRKWSAALPNR